ncbi:MAG: LexA family protein [Alphaproteobacteria bacterium]
MLTEKQYKLLEFIKIKMKDKPVSPSFEEMREAMGVKSKSTISSSLSILEKKGFIKKYPKSARAIEVLK